MTPSPSKLPRQGELWQDSFGGFHRVLTLATSHEGLRPLVVYRPTHPKSNGTWACEMAEFLGTRNDGTRNFVRVASDSEQDVWDYLSEVLPAHVIHCALDCYDQPWRVYHGRAHVIGLFAFAKQQNFELTPVQSVALLFHDAVYLPGAPSGENERASVVLMRLTCGGLPEAMLAAAQAIILDTIEHRPTTPQSHLVQDLDLSVFVTAAHGVQDPSMEVWSEYRPLLPCDDQEAAGVFWRARGQVLSSLMALSPLYTSAEFRQKPALEALARTHLQRELERASAGQVPDEPCR